MADGMLREVLPVLTVTEDAIARILQLREAEEDPAALALRVEVTGQQGVEYTYDLAFDPLADATDADACFDQGGLPVVVPSGSVEVLRGATLDVPAGPGPGLVLRNPNRPDPMAVGDLELVGTPAERVRTLLEQRINPALAAHGGFAVLDRVEEPVAYITMGGGCQGCAVSAMTLRDGISAAILEAIPEITEVADVTDHGAGENPFY